MSSYEGICERSLVEVSVAMPDVILALDWTLGLRGGVRSVSVGSLGLVACSTGAGGSSSMDTFEVITNDNGQESSSGGKG